MKEKLEQALADWLRAEAENDDGEAQKALFALFRGRRSEAPRAGFVERTMARVSAPSQPRPQPLAPPRWVLWEWGFKLGVAVSLALAGVSAILLSGMAAEFARNGGGSRVVGWGIGMVTAGSEFLARVLVAVDGLIRAGAAIASATIGPEHLGAVLVGLLISLLAFHMLSHLVAFERSTNHV